MGGKRIVAPEIPPRAPRTPMHKVRDAILEMTWRDLEGLAELIDEIRCEDGGGRDGPLTGKVLNDWAHDIKLEGDPR